MDLQTLCVEKLEAALKDNDLERFEKLFSEKNFAKSTKAVNPFALVCKYGRENFLEYLFGDNKVWHSLQSLAILPNDEDTSGHTAVYYSIRSGNIALLGVLMDNWPTTIQSFDGVLAEAYRELKVRNVSVARDVEYFVQEKLLNRRFLSNDSDVAVNNNNLWFDVRQLITLYKEHVELLSQVARVDEKFLFIAKRIAQDIHILKHQLKCTYNELPWEEIEFCLLTFVASHANRREVNLSYHGTIDRDRMIEHLMNFTAKLEKVADTIASFQPHQLISLPDIKRDGNISRILDRNPQFEDLYDDYHQIRDIRSLERIGHYLELAVRSDPTRKEGQLVIMRSLQVIGLYFRNTLESPNMSTFTRERLLVLCPESTRKIILSLMYSTTHASSLSRRIDLEEKSNNAFFSAVQSDMVKIAGSIVTTLQAYKDKVYRILLEKLIDCTDIDEIKRMCILLLRGDTSAMLKRELFTQENFQRLESEFVKLNTQFLACTLSTAQRKIVDEIDRLMKIYKNIINNKASDYLYQISMAQYNLQKLYCKSNMDEDATSTMEMLKGELDKLPSINVHYRDLKESMQLLVQFLNNDKNLKVQPNEFEEILKTIFEIFHILNVDASDVDWVIRFSEEFHRKEMPPHECKLTEKDYDKQLKQKLNEMKGVLKSPSYSDTRQLQAALEILTLDVLEMLRTPEKCLENHLMLLDGDASVLVGESLRDYLAHGNAAIDVLKFDLAVTLMTNARNFVSGDLIGTDGSIGRPMVRDVSDLQKSFRTEFDIINNQESMFAALERGQLDSMKKYIERGADVFSRSVNHWTALHFAAKLGDLDILEYLISLDVDFKSRDIHGQTFLHIAATYGKSHIVDFILKNKCEDVNNVDEFGRTALHFAAQNGHVQTVEILFQYDTDLNSRDELGYPALHHAVDCNRVDVVKVFFEKNVDPLALEKSGEVTSLHVAAQRGHVDLVKFLIEKNADVHAKTPGKATPIHLAALHGHLEVVRALISHGSGVDAKSPAGCTPLHYAAERGYTEIVRVLIENGADPNCVNEDSVSTPLQYAVDCDRQETIEELLKHNANPSFISRTGVTPLHSACFRGIIPIVEALVNHGANVKDDVFTGCLHIAVQYDHYNIAELLIERGINIDGVHESFTNGTPLHVAAATGNVGIIELLIKNKANVHVEDANNLTPLNLAIFYNNCAALDVLIKRGLTDECRRKTVTALLLFAAKNGGKIEAIDVLIKCGANVNACDESKVTALHAATQRGREEIVDLLIKNKANIRAKNTDGQTALHVASSMGLRGIVEILIANGAPIDPRDNNKMTPLLVAVANGREDVVDILLAKGADVNVNNGKPVYQAISAKNKNILKKLLNNKARIKNNCLDGSTLLHFAVHNGDSDIVEILLQRGIAVNCVNSDQNTPLLVACMEGYDKIVEVLLKYEADVNCRTKNDKTPIQVAASSRDNSRTLELLYYHNSNIKYHDVIEAFELAAHYNFTENVKFFMRHTDIQVNEGDVNGYTVLHHAALEGSVEMVELLIREGADMNVTDCRNEKPLHLAARQGHLDVIKCLLNLGMNIEEPGMGNRTPLHYAVLYDKINVVEYLIAQGADMNSKDSSGSAPIRTATLNHKKHLVKLLLRHGAVFDVQDPKDKKNAERLSLDLMMEDLIEGIKIGDCCKVKASIAAGASVNARYSKLAPLHYAAWKGSAEIVGYLLLKSADPNSVDTKGWTPLHYASSHSHFATVKALLIGGAIYNVVATSFGTPARLAKDQRIINLFRFIDTSFGKVTRGDVSVTDDFKKLSDVGNIRAVMSALNSQKDTLITCAIRNNFRQLQQLKEIMQAEFISDIRSVPALASQQRYAEALEIWQKVLNRRMQLFGPNNPATLDIQNEIAAALHEQHKYEEVLKLLEDVYKRRCKVLGKNERSTLMTRSLIGLSLHHLGKNMEALTIYKDVFEKQKHILQPHDEIFLSTQLHLALVLNALRLYDNALPINEHVYNMFKDTLGDHNRTTLVAQNNLAITLLQLNNFDEALRHYNDILEKRKEIKTFGATHPDTLKIMHSIANVYFKQKNYKKALKAFEELLKIQKEVLGENALHTLDVQYCIGRIYYNQGKYDAALEMMSSTYAERKAILGPNHPDIKDTKETIDILVKRCKSTDKDEVEKILYKGEKEAVEAVTGGDGKLLKKLMERRLEIDYEDNGRTLLHRAVDAGNVEIVEILMKYGADVKKVTKDGDTTLHLAVSNGCKEIIEILLTTLEKDALDDFVNAPTRNGSTALHIAAENGFDGIVKILLEHKAIYNSKNKNGKTPIDICTNQNIMSFLQFIDEAFNDARRGNEKLIDRLKTLPFSDLQAVTNTRGSGSKTIAQIAIVNKRTELAKSILKLLQVHAK